ncbi:hypothetical protein SNEBB_009486 [Seison nebaliae]|nr:hypothetical protein SNEBB_009486 [Seison nebaliae]
MLANKKSNQRITRYHPPLNSYGGNNELKKQDKVMQYFNTVGIRSPTEEEDTLADHIHFLGMFFSIVGLFAKLKICSWGALICSIIGFAHSATVDENRQTVSSFMLSISALLMSYLNNPQPLSYQLGILFG